MMTAQFKSLLISSAKSFPQAVSAIVILTGCSMLVGWLYGAAFGMALLASSNIVVFAVLLYRTVVALNRSDVERERAEDVRCASEERFAMLVAAVEGDANLLMHPIG